MMDDSGYSMVQWVRRIQGVIMRGNIDARRSRERDRKMKWVRFLVFYMVNVWTFGSFFFSSKDMGALQISTIKSSRDGQNVGFSVALNIVGLSIFHHSYSCTFILPFHGNLKCKVWKFCTKHGNLKFLVEISSTLMGPYDSVGSPSSSLLACVRIR